MREAGHILDEAPGRVLGALSNDLVSLHKATCGKGPIRAAAHASGDTLTCVMHGGLSHSEKKLLQHGDEGTVKLHRESLHRVMQDDARAIVERHTGRRVGTVLYSCDPADDAEAIVFLFAPDELDELSGRRGA